ncbi:hypothetical protein BH10CYA1_BH10CYA1_23470 [soil metagenome]
MDDDYLTRQSADHTHKCPTCGLAVSATQSTCPVDGTPIAEHLPGFILDGKYEFNELIGSGGMGVIYKARQIILNRPVAVKMMHSHMLSDKAIMRFQREGKAGSALSHPNITVVLDFAISEHGQPYMVMDFEVGQTLSQMIEQKGVLSPAFVVDAMIQICQALTHAHERNVLHRDIKPSNMMVIERKDEPPLIKILDFGIAKILDTGEGKDKTITRTGETMGSPPYMSPEQSVSSNIDQRADLYSLGCVMFECLAGTPPFFAENVFSIMMAHANETPPTLKEATLGKEFPGELERIVKKLLEKNVNGRYQSAKELLSDLERFKTGGNAPIGGPSKQSNANLKPKLVAIASVGALVLAAASFAIFQTKIPTTVKPNPAANGIANDAKTKDHAAGERSKEVVVLTAEKFKEETAADQTMPEGKEAIETFLKKRDAVLQLGNLEIHDADLSVLSDYTLCRSLELQNNQLNGTGLGYLSKLKNIGSIRLDGNKISDASLKPLGDLPKLKILNFSSNNKFTGEGFADIETKPEINGLSLKFTAMSDKGFEALKKFASIEGLELAHTPVSKNAAMSLAKLQNMLAIDLSDTDLKNDALTEFCKTKTPLAKLFLNDNRIDNNSVKEIVKLRCLTDLDVSGTDINAKGIVQLANLPNLQHLWCESCNASKVIGALSHSRPDLLITENPRKTENTIKSYSDEVEAEGKL